jgi:phage virion morphogenesis protein
MTGAAFTLDIDDDKLRRALAALVARGADLTPLFRNWGEAMLKQHESRWKDQVSPDGTPWAPLSPEYAARKALKRPSAGTLTYDEHLRRLHYNASRDTLEFGSERVYAATHEYGAPERGIPPRPFLGVSDSDREALLDIAGDYFAAALEEGAI